MDSYFSTDYQRKIFLDRYAQTKEDGTKETIEETFWRIAFENEDVFQILMNKQAIFGGRIISNMGGRGNNMPGNCNTVPLLEDSLDAIMKCQSDTVKVYAKGGGVGTNFSVLRPKDAPVQGAEHGSSGACSFIDAQEGYAETIRQGGSRRAAKMSILNISHPDAEEFIHAKTDHNRWTNTNVSVGIFDEFMRAVEGDFDWNLTFNGKVYRTVSARKLWHEICECAWKSAEPGVVFLDTINSKSPLRYKYEIKETNPCVSGDTEIRTIEGMKKAKDITLDDYIETVAGFEKVTSIEKHNNYPVYSVELSNGATILATASHIFYGQKPTDTFTDTRELKLSELKPQDRIFTNPYDERNMVTASQAKKYKENWAKGVRTSFRVEKVSEFPVEYTDVYDFYCEGSDTYIVNGCVSRGCGEQPLVPYGQCLLASIVLPSFVSNNGFEFEDFRCVVRAMVRHMDCIIDRASYPIPEIEEVAKKTRPIGLGFTGLADALFLLELPYGTDKDTLDFIDSLMDIMYETAKDESEKLAQEKGAFPDYDPELADFPPRRNSTLLSFAPTGTISGLVGCSYGIEPHFAPIVTRNEDLGRDVVGNPIIDKYMQDHNLTEFPEWARFVGGTNEKYSLSVEDHLAVLKVIANYCDSAVSKCVAEGTLIETNLGILPVEKLGSANQPDEFAPPLAGLKVRDKEGNWQRVTSHYCGGKKRTKKIRFNNGQEIECSLTHKFLTSSGWVFSSMLEEGDVVLLNRKPNLISLDGGLKLPRLKNGKTNSNLIMVPDKMSDDLALWCGFMVADGHLEESTGQVALSTANDKIGELFISLSDRMFGVTPKVLTDNRNRVKTYTITSRRFSRWCKELFGYRASDKHIPEVIMQGSNSEQLAFIKGVSLDGYYREQSSDLVIYEGKSKLLQQQLFAIASKFGWEPKLLSKKVKGYNYSVYQIRTTAQVDVAEAKKARRTSQGLGSLIPVTSEMLECSVSAKHPSYSALRSLKQRNSIVTREKTLKSLGIPYNTDIVACKVTTISDSFNKVYDIEVENTHSYLLGNIISHNTVNLPEDATIEDVSNVYMYCWQNGIKGCTVYRNNCRKDQPVSWDTEETEDSDETDDDYFEVIDYVQNPKFRPDEVEGCTYKVKFNPTEPPMYVVINDVEEEPLEIFFKVNNAHHQEYLDGLSRAITSLWRRGIRADHLFEEFCEYESPNAGSFYEYKRGKRKYLKSILDAIGTVVQKHFRKLDFEDERVVASQDCIATSISEVNDSAKGQKCPNCKEYTLQRVEGCLTCTECGYSKCG